MENIMSRIMKLAWKLQKKFGGSFSESLKSAWRIAKHEVNAWKAGLPTRLNGVSAERVLSRHISEIVINGKLNRELATKMIVAQYYFEDKLLRSFYNFDNLSLEDKIAYIKGEM